MWRQTYFRSTGISKPRNSNESNAASPLIQPRNGVAIIGSFARADRLALLLFLHFEAEEFERLVARSRHTINGVPITCSPNGARAPNSASRVSQEGSPSLAWWPTPFDHVLGDA